MSKKAQIQKTTREIEEICTSLPLLKRIRIGNLCRKIRIAAGKYDNFLVEVPGVQPSSQTEMIRDYLMLGHGLTSLDALRHFGCARLGARIWDLRHDRKNPLNIRTETIHDVTTGKHYASYSLIKEEKI